MKEEVELCSYLYIFWSNFANNAVELVNLNTKSKIKTERQ